MTGKLYQVTDIDFGDLIIEAIECNLDISNISEEEIFNIEQFKDFRIKLVNGGDRGETINFEEWKKGSLKYQLNK